MIVISWLLLAASLLINLISHRISALNCYKTMSEIGEDGYNSEKATKRHKQVDNYNKATIGTLGIGILFLILFSLLNLYNMNNSDKQSNPALNERGMNPIPVPKPQTGLIPTPPPQSPPPSNPPPKKDS
jgi:hypothetical protein